MSFTNRVIEALINDHNDIIMTIEDIQSATIQELLLYYTYTQLMGIDWIPDSASIDNFIDINGQITFKKNHDINIIAYFLTHMPYDYGLICKISDKSKEDFIEYSRKYNILSNLNIINFMKAANIDNDDVRMNIIRVHS